MLEFLETIRLFAVDWWPFFLILACLKILWWNQVEIIGEELERIADAMEDFLYEDEDEDEEEER